jgi:thiol-disulfide isomerase/thioredoxin
MPGGSKVSRFKLPLPRAVFFLALAVIPVLALSTVLNGETNADQVMTRIESQAQAQHKNILLSFGASWCVNCRLFDKFLADSAIKPILEKQFIFADLNTGEVVDTSRHANLPGGQKLQASLGGKDAGYPFLAMVDPNGKLIVNSMRPDRRGNGENIGYPVSAAEIDWFMEMVKRGAPSLSPEDSAVIRYWLTAQSHKH